YRPRQSHRTTGTVQRRGGQQWGSRTDEVTMLARARARRAVSSPKRVGVVRARVARQAPVHASAAQVATTVTARRSPVFLAWIKARSPPPRVTAREPAPAAPGR